MQFKSVPIEPAITTRVATFHWSMNFYTSAPTWSAVLHGWSHVSAQPRGLNIFARQCCQYCFSFNCALFSWLIKYFSIYFYLLFIKMHLHSHHKLWKCYFIFDRHLVFDVRWIGLLFGRIFAFSEKSVSNIAIWLFSSLLKLSNIRDPHGALSFICAFNLKHNGPLWLIIIK